MNQYLGLEVYFFHLFIYVFNLFIYLFIYLFICLFIHVFIYFCFMQVSMQSPQSQAISDS